MTDLPKQKLNSQSTVESIWWIGFTDAEGPVKWWDLFTKKGFRHIYIYAEIDNKVIVYTMTKGGLITSYVDLSRMDSRFTIHEYLKTLYKGSIVVPVKSKVVVDRNIWRLAPFTCVELARSLLGIHKMVFTPYGLYKYITDNKMVAGTVVN